MAVKPKCKACGKIINGIVKFVTRRKKSGAKMINIVDYYDEHCFLLLNKERSANGNSNKKRSN
jgi:hypothetical protein